MKWCLMFLAAQRLTEQRCKVKTGSRIISQQGPAGVHAVGGEPELRRGTLGRQMLVMQRGDPMALSWSSIASPLTELLKCWLKTSRYQKAIKLNHLGTHNHVLQSTLGQPAIQENRNEDVPYGGPEDLRNNDIFSCYAAKHDLALLAWWSDYRFGNAAPHWPRCILILLRTALTVGFIIFSLMIL